MTWLKTNSYTIVTMLIYQFGVMLMGMILVNILTVGQGALMILASLYAAGFYMVLLYFYTWDHGAKDAIRAEGGRAAFDRMAGLKLSLCANIPNILLALLMLVGFLLGQAFASFPWAQGMFGVSHVIAVCWESMYTGFINAVLPPDSTSSMAFGYVIAYLLTPLPAIAASTFGYMMGGKGKRLFGFMQKTNKN